MSILIGRLAPLTDPAEWQGSDDDAYAASQQVELLLAALSQESTMRPVEVTEIPLTAADTFPLALRSCLEGETADEVLLTIDEVFDAGSLTVGDDSDPASLVGSIDLAQLVAGEQWQLSPQFRFLADTDVKAFLTGSPTTGAARLTLYTYLPEA